jgi:glycine cleavage system H protein
MTAHRVGLREGLQVGGLAVLLLAAFPVLAIAAFMLRGVVFAIAVAAVIGAIVAYAVSPGFRGWLDFAGLDVVEYKGLRLPTDVALSPAHVWARVDGDEATLGIDDLAQSALGPVDQVELPSVGDEVERGWPLFAIRRGDRALVARAPVNGRVAAVNAALRAAPQRVNESPFGTGWAVRVEGEGMRQQRRELIRGLSARDWFRQEVDRLILTMAARDAAPTLPDGGLVAGDLYQHVDDALWPRLEASFFGSARALAERPRTDLIV